MVGIDERLVYGQVALVWSRNLGVDRILVVNDKAAAARVQTATFNHLAMIWQSASVRKLHD
ncbi:PTS sugar transporter subunit IIB [Lacticaseibacillus zeae]|uniref:PTS sugar transporter subunit IIB n=1 Tax=Lacticaseibacillus zeae subsp. silagei TaxID=3068307 RepID=A0ABD7ZDQ2_LACZE|nr:MULTISPECIES: PTS sugar transporter subunit IIB [Lacticaseibacillus]MDE3316610.1 PTS sugar transporter subunit IIB [Lacticaseibacillus zeae]WLV85069.1 PTS sugar transporter subunit IIB [Lacticaseibacillus sp. NCIMB 15475]WLV87793.1 PTS sugar transporter subunit IIB [Lacticaseibacillus sp. NCIMB 15474]